MYINGWTKLIKKTKVVLRFVHEDDYYESKESFTFARKKTVSVDI